MGGGAALSYAARHRDPERGAFAAVVNHTGTISLRNTYHNVSPDQQGLMHGMLIHPLLVVKTMFPQGKSLVGCVDH